MAASCCATCACPISAITRSKVPKPGAVNAEATRVQGQFIRDVMKLNPKNFRVFSPDETTSNRWGAVFEVTNRCSTAEIIPGDDHVAPDGRVMEMLSEHQCEGWLEGYLLTGRHGFFSCYEAFIHIVDSMFNQHAKWLKVTRDIPWRRPIASLNYLLTSHVWRQDHNGFTHQDPGFIDHVVNKKAEVIRVYLPPDANTLLSVTDHCLRSRNYVNVIVAGKQPSPQWLDMDAAIKHCTAGIGIWPWASNDQGGEPDVVMACCGDVPTLETLAAVELLRKHFPELKIRVINVVDLMKLQSQSEHPHGLSDKDFDVLFTTDKPIIFAYHGYPSLIHRLTYRRTNHQNIHVRGYKEEGTTTTPFDMVVMNDLDRFHLVADVIDRVPQLGSSAAHVKQAIRDKLIEHKHYIAEHGEDMPEIRNWQWGAKQVIGMPMLQRLYLVRHGETAWSLSGQHTGRTDIPLTEQGEQDARKLAERLHAVRFSRVFTSPLQRARRTCELTGLNEVAEIEPDLAEWDYGDYEGQRPVDIRKGRPDWNLFRDGCPRGESPAQVSERADRLIARLRTLEGNIAIFSHGHFGRVLAARWIGLRVRQAQHFLLSTASLSVLGYGHNLAEKSAIVLWNAISNDIST